MSEQHPPRGRSALAALRAVGLLAARWSGLVLAVGLFTSGWRRPGGCSLWVEGLVALLVGLEQVVAWRTRLPVRWEIAGSTATMAAAISSYLDLYARIWWWDLAAHALVTGVLAVLAAWLIRRPRPGAIVAAGLVLALSWEAMELWGHAYVDSTVNVAPWDTVGDLAAGLMGSVGAAALWRARGTSEPEGTGEWRAAPGLRRPGAAGQTAGVAVRTAGFALPGFSV
ncbi:hypothetical protein BRM1_08945 [Brevibacterium sp. BRM-1]|uniref:hypothetical protein n=1 Tax=Brevibacterium sp. BRM-1 TaxID=2999062 RepID=UPI00228077D2|nr:hypothetical protein [Brevibacterium sp. BRM-1]WAL39405.1 hypothetical protein BRM1_08945 [Brevibacterium sp. BRM-1]